MAVGVIMPRQGQSVESCIIEWKVKEGDAVKEGDVLFGYETDKASFEEESAVSGTVLKLLVADGDDVPCLDTVCVIGKPGEDIAKFLNGSVQENTTNEEEAATQAAPAATPEITAKSGDSIKISPRARNIAARQNLDITKAEATGPDGRIIERDIMVLAEKGYKVTAAASSVYNGGADGSGIGGAVTTADILRQPAPSAAPMAAEAGYTEVKLSNVRKVIARSMHASLSEMAQLTLNARFDATSAMAYRSRVKANMEALGLPNITLNDIVLYATAKTLKKHPDINAHYLGDTMRQFHSVNLGVAVDTPRGLLVPTIFGADTMSLAEISTSAKEVASGAQSGSISPDLLTGGTFTVTNLGSLGVESFTPVINPPQTCILGVCSITYQQKKSSDGFVTYPAMGLSLTFDHRAVDGAPAARFLKDLCAALETFELTLAI